MGWMEEHLSSHHGTGEKGGRWQKGEGYSRTLAQLMKPPHDVDFFFGVAQGREKEDERCRKREEKREKCEKDERSGGLEKRERERSEGREKLGKE